MRGVDICSPSRQGAVVDAAAGFGGCVYYGTLAGLIESLMDAKAAGELSPSPLRVLTHRALLVVDVIGYLPVT